MVSLGSVVVLNIGMNRLVVGLVLSRTPSTVVVVGTAVVVDAVSSDVVLDTCGVLVVDGALLVLTESIS